MLFHLEKIYVSSLLDFDVFASIVIQQQNLKSGPSFRVCNRIFQEISLLSDLRVIYYFV